MEIIDINNPGELIDCLKTSSSSQPSRALVQSAFKNLHRFARDEASRFGGISGRRFVVVSTHFISALSPLSLGLLTAAEQRKLFVGYFTDGPLLDAFLVVSKGIGSCDDFIFEKLLLVLRDFLKGKSLLRLFLHFSTECIPSSQLEKDAQQANFYRPLAQAIVSIPEKVANQRRGVNIPSDFVSEAYFRHIAALIAQTLRIVHTQLSSERDCSLVFLSELVGKLEVSGYGRIALNLLVPFLSKHSSDDFIWQRIAQKLILSVPQLSQEAVLVGFLARASNYDAINKLFGDAITKDQGIAFILTRKLLLMRYFARTSPILVNLIGHLASDKFRSSRLVAVLRDLFDVWGSKTSVLQMDQEQHIYLSSAIVLSIRALARDVLETVRHDLLAALLKAIPIYIGTSEATLKKVGMAVGEICDEVLNPFLASNDSDGGEKSRLKFDYKDDSDTAFIKALTCEVDVAVTNADGDLADVNFDQFFLDDASESETTLNDEDEPLREKSAALDSDDDSEDDVKPFHFIPPEQRSRIVVVDAEKELKAPVMAYNTQPAKPPAYVRDAMEGLLEDKDVQKFEVCLKALEPLVRREAFGFRDVAVDAVRILLHLEDRFALDDFTALCFRSMLACCVKAPDLCIPFLTKQLYQRNYSLRQRYDILIVIREAAKELSGWTATLSDDDLTQTTDADSQVIGRKPVDKFSSLFTIGQKLAASEEISKSDADTPKLDFDLAGPTPDCPQIWQQIIAERIEAKTRRFNSSKFSGMPKSGSELKANKLAPIVGDFFFPLLANYDRPTEKCFDMIGRDCFLLGQLLYTLASVLFYAQHSPLVLRMAKALLELIWAQRFHEEGFIRQGLVFALCKVVISLSPALLVQELQQQMCDAKEWLEYILQRDNDVNCKRLAAVTLMQLCTKMKEGLGNSES